MTWTPDSPPPCPCCGTRLVERTEPDGGEEGGMLYAYDCPACRWEDAGSYDYQRLTVATAPWTRDLWAELVRTREERDTLAARVRELEAETTTRGGLMAQLDRHYPADLTTEGGGLDGPGARVVRLVREVDTLRRRITDLHEVLCSDADEATLRRAVSSLVYEARGRGEDR